MTHQAPPDSDVDLLREQAPARSESHVPPHPKALRYPNAYVWFVFVSALDLMLTWVILHLGGREVNWIADAVIYTHDLWGLVGFKFAIVALVVILCEEVGRRNDRSGRPLARWAIAIAALPVVVSTTQLLAAIVVG